jgi:plasmid stabilization system protein ParE
VARIVWTDSAIDDIRAIGEFYERSSLVFARAIVTDLYESVGRLARFPYSGRVVPELDEDAIREVIESGFRVVYEVVDEDVRVLTVIHTRQSLRKKLDSSD